jgi:hypothetical protein
LPVKMEGCGAMKEYRLTFATEDFGAISQMLVDMGVGFTVELAEPAPAETPAKQRAKKPAKSAPKKKAGGTGSAPKRSQSPLAGANQMLARLARGEDDDSSDAAAAAPAAGSAATEEPDETGA